MTLSQLQALVGCILKYKAYEVIIQSITDTEIKISICNTWITLEEFALVYYPRLKIYLTEDDDSLVSINKYLEHYNIK